MGLEVGVCTPPTNVDVTSLSKGLRFGMVIAIVTSFLLGNNSQCLAQNLNPVKIRGSKQKSHVTVLQNRHFQKVFRPEVGLVLGSIINEAYTNTRSYGLRAGLFVSELIGFEFQSLKTAVEDTDDRMALNSLRYRPVDTLDPNLIVSPDPEVNPIRKITDYSILLAPFYGKLNFMDRFIIYSDLYLSAGYSQVTTDQKDHNALSIGVGQRFYFSNNLSARIDFRDRIYSEIRADEDTRKHSYSFDVGMSYFFR